MDVNSRERDNKKAKEKWSEFTGTTAEKKAPEPDFAFSGQYKESSKQNN